MTLLEELELKYRVALLDHLEVKWKSAKFPDVCWIGMPNNEWAGLSKSVITGMLRLMGNRLTKAKHFIASDFVCLGEKAYNAAFRTFMHDNQVLLKALGSLPDHYGKV